MKEWSRLVENVHGQEHMIYFDNCFSSRKLLQI
jgi:hypothetical protein